MERGKTPKSNGSEDAHREAGTRVDSTGLTGKFLKRFQRIQQDVAASYTLALDSLSDKSRLPYPPVVRVTPFVIVKYRRSGGSLYRQTYYAFTFVDVENFDRFAIYPSLDFLEKFPNYVAAGLAHELGHVMAFNNQSVSIESMVEVIATPLKAERRKEEDMVKALEAFDPKFKEVIIEWNGVSLNKDSKEFLVENARQVTGDQFESLMFGKRKKLLDEYLTSKGLRLLKQASNQSNAGR